MDYPVRLQVDQRLIPEEGLPLQGKLAPSIFDIPGTARLACKVPLDHDLTAFVVEGRVLVQGRLKTTVTCTCDRCLEVYELVIEVPDVCHYYEVVEDDRIDLTADIREDIVIAFPDKLLCAAECQGFCSVCGQILNTHTCECTAGTTAPSVWDELDRFSQTDTEADPDADGKVT